MSSPLSSPVDSRASTSPIVVFDFDGTLADSLDAVVAAYNRIAPLLRARPVSPHQLSRLGTLAPREALREHAISLWKLPLVVFGVKATLRLQATPIEPFAGIPSVLGALAQAGCRCSILSTNSRANIQRFLQTHQLRMFESVSGGASMFGKARAIERLLRAKNLDRRRAVYVGDEVRDVQAARRSGLRSIAVSWGYADRGALAAARPDHLIDRPEELLALLVGPHAFG